MRPELYSDDALPMGQIFSPPANWDGMKSPGEASLFAWEAAKLAGFQVAGNDPRTAGGFSFGRRDGEAMPFVNPVSTAFAMQALALWDRCRGGDAQPHRHLLI